VEKWDFSRAPPRLIETVNASRAAKKYCNEIMYELNKVKTARHQANGGEEIENNDCRVWVRGRISPRLSDPCLRKFPDSFKLSKIRDITPDVEFGGRAGPHNDDDDYSDVPTVALCRRGREHEIFARFTHSVSSGYNYREICTVLHNSIL
jgi:hypothetical protein